MHSLHTHSARWISAALTVGIVVCLLGTSGCACLRLPRIDPTGERCLIWPKDQPQAAITAGNPTAPPVLTDPFFPAKPTSAVPVQAARPPEVLKVSPERILAPIGSEVVIKAGICEKSGYLLSDQKLQWQLARNGVGQFVEVGGKGLLRRAFLPWNQSAKIANYYATGYTAASPLCITRGTADPSDDVAIRRGDGWVSVTSPVEGTSYVTAYAPNVATWNARKSTAQIHWVDVQWTFPPTTVQSNGQPQLLTTTVTRQSDGTPLEGYLVRYEVADGGALRSQSTGQVVEVRTDAQGKATVEVAPTDSGANQSRIDAQLVRPADYGSGTSPKLVIGSGATIVNWKGNEPYFTPGTPAPLPSAPRPLEPMPNQPTPAGPKRAPQLDVEIYRVTPGQVRVDGQVRFEVIIKNVGDAPATGLSLNDRFERGFRHLADPTGEQEITTDLKYILAPGQQNSEYITFDVTKAGRICHEVIVSSVEGARATKGDCVDAVQPAPEPRAGVQIKKVGPRDAVVGEPQLFTVTVTNTGETALTNVEVRDSYPVELAPQPGRDYEKLGNDIIWRIPRLEMGQSKRFDVYAQGLQPSLRATSYAEVSALAEGVPGNYRSASEHTLEIKPLRGGAPGGTVPGGVTNADGNLKIRLESLNDTVRVGTRQRYRVTIENVGQNVDGLVYMRVIFPQGMRPDVLAAQGPQNVQTEFDAGQNAIVFTPVKSLRPREVLPYEFNADVNQPGSGTITAEAVSSNSAAGVIDAVNVQMIR